MDQPGDALYSDQFQAELSEIVDLVNRSAWLFVARNKLPLALLGDKGLQQGGIAMYHSNDEIRQYAQGLERRGNQLMQYASRTTLIVPAMIQEYFKKERALFMPNSDTPGGMKPSKHMLETLWVEFVNDWNAEGGPDRNGALRYFSADDQVDHSQGFQSAVEELERAVRTSLRVDNSEDGFINTLPDVWVCLTDEAMEKFGARTSFDMPADEVRGAVEKLVLNLAAKLALHEPQYERDFKDMLGLGNIRIIKVSTAEFAPRFRGWRIREPNYAASLFVHLALSYCRSTLEPGPDEP